MEWNYYWNENDVTHFSLFESTGDSEEVKPDVYNPHYDHNHNYGHHAQEQDHEVVVKDHAYDQDVSPFRYKEGEYKHNDNDNDNDDDAQSCSYDHSSYINTTSYSNSYQAHESQRLVYDGGDVVNDDDDDNGVVNNDDEYNNWGDESSKLIDPSHNYCVDSSTDQREIDRRFWETCLGT